MLLHRPRAASALLVQVGKPEHIVEASHNPNVDAVAIADLLHYGCATTNDLKSF